MKAKENLGPTHRRSSRRAPPAPHRSNE